jgi:hypothetical protein
MGFNTVIMFSNDAYDQFERHPDQTTKNVLKAMNGVKENRHHYGVGNHANPMVVKKPRHADHDMIYMHSGNTLCEMSEYSTETEELMKNHPDFFEQMLKKMESDLAGMKEKFNAIQKKQKV